MSDTTTPGREVSWGMYANSAITRYSANLDIFGRVPGLLWLAVAMDAGCSLCLALFASSPVVAVVMNAGCSSCRYHTDALFCFCMVFMLHDIDYFQLCSLD